MGGKTQLDLHPRGSLLGIVPITFLFFVPFTSSQCPHDVTFMFFQHSSKLTNLLSTWMCFNFVPNICQICYDIFLIWTPEFWPSIPLCSNVFHCGIPITFLTTTSMPHHDRSCSNFGMHTHNAIPTHLQTNAFNIQLHLYLIFLFTKFSWANNKMVKSILTWLGWKHMKLPKNCSHKFFFLELIFLVMYGHQILDFLFF